MAVTDNRGAPRSRSTSAFFVNRVALAQADQPASEIAAAARAMQINRLDFAEDLLRRRLAVAPNDAVALQMMGEIAGRVGQLAQAEALLVEALSLAPDMADARFKLAVTLHRQSKDSEALAQILKVRAENPAHPDYRVLEAAIRTSIGDHAQSLKLHEGLFEQGVDGPRIRLTYGHTLKTLGRTDEAAATYRRLLTSSRPEDKPLCGEVWWSLANLKNNQLDAEDREAIRRVLCDSTLSEDGRTQLYYALGSSLEGAGDTDAAFAAFSAGAALRRRSNGYDAANTTNEVRRALERYTPSFFASRQGKGCAAADPIFIVGLPRSGSTLLEQILSSHPQVEGTMELAELPRIVRELGSLPRDAYLDTIARLTAGDLRALGEVYLTRTRIYRKSTRPFFIDKMPNNWMYVGLIRLILPNAKIVDARRHPLGSCLSAFKQLFRVGGQAFSYELGDLGRYYRDYTEMMNHMQLVAPGTVHRVIYEDLVEDTEAQVRRLLDYCGLDFHPACLRFHETKRAVRTPSAEQVRRPIYRDGLEQWRAYEAHLAPLKLALGSALDNWR